MAKVRKARELKAPKSFMLYGPYKVGKTTLAASIIKVPGIKKVLLIDIDLGASALGEDFPDVDVMEFKRGDIKDFEKEWAKLVASNGGGYDAVILDTVTILQSWKEASMPKADGFLKWAEIKAFTLSLMWDLHEMKPIGIASFHIEMANIMKGSEEGDDEYTRLVPSLQGKAKISIGAIPDVIGYIDVEETKEGELIHYAQWKPGEKTMTGNRFKRIPAKLKTDGGMARVYEFINNTAK